MLTPEKLKTMAQRKLQTSEEMSTAMSLFEDKVAEAIDAGQVAINVPAPQFQGISISDNDKKREVMAQELLHRGFDCRKEKRGSQPVWRVYFI